MTIITHAHAHTTQEPCHDPMFNIGPKKSVRVNNAVITTDEWEIPPSHVIIEDCLGEGAFGEVYHGIIRGPIVNPKVHPSMKSAICTAVAIKLLKCKLSGKTIMFQYISVYVQYTIST